MGSQSECCLHHKQRRIGHFAGIGMQTLQPLSPWYSGTLIFLFCSLSATIFSLDSISIAFILILQLLHSLLFLLVIVHLYISLFLSVVEAQWKEEINLRYCPRIYSSAKFLSVIPSSFLQMILVSFIFLFCWANLMAVSSIPAHCMLIIYKCTYIDLMYWMWISWCIMSLSFRVRMRFTSPIIPFHG